jgi:hypothetical protein
LGAQWLDWPTPGIPRTADGKPNLTAPAPRTPDGKPDLSGLWQPAPNPYRFDLIQSLQDEAIFRPAAEAVFQRRIVDFRRDDPVTNCLPGGPSDMLSTTYRIMQSPRLSRCCTRTAPAAIGRSTWTDERYPRIRTRHGWAIP